LQNPHQLAKHNSVYYSRIFGSAALRYEPAGLPGLVGIVLHRVSNKNVGIDSLHARVALFLTARSISSSETRRGAGASSPFSSFPSMFAGTRTTRPSASTTNSTRSPALSRRWRRITPGIVVCPLLVIVEVAMSLLTIIFLTLYPYKEATFFSRERRPPIS